MVHNMMRLLHLRDLPGYPPVPVYLVVGSVPSRQLMQRPYPCWPFCFVVSKAAPHRSQFIACTPYSHATLSATSAACALPHACPATAPVRAPGTAAIMAAGPAQIAPPSPATKPAPAPIAPAALAA